MTSLDAMESAMNDQDWTQQCADRLLEQWPRVGRDDLEHLADALCAEQRWKSMEPTQAAELWLQQGIPGVAASVQGAL